MWRRGRQCASDRHLHVTPHVLHLVEMKLQLLVEPWSAVRRHRKERSALRTIADFFLRLKGTAIRARMFPNLSISRCNPGWILWPALATSRSRDPSGATDAGNAWACTGRKDICISQDGSGEHGAHHPRRTSNALPPRSRPSRRRNSHGLMTRISGLYSLPSPVTKLWPRPAIRIRCAKGTLK